MSFLARFKRRPPAPAREPARIPDGERVYAIGDIHGRDDLFADLLDRITADCKSRVQATTTLILLGDLVDRGPSSSSVVERAMAIGAPFDHVRMLVGNHEEAFLAALDGDIQRLRYFVRIGGDATIRSYWHDDASYAAATFEEVAARLPAIVPERHSRFLAGGEDMIRIGDYVFVHAGVRPGRALCDQKVKDLRWIRDEFISAEPDWEETVVHGHTISKQVDIGRNRIGIDTGAYASGTLTAIGLEAGQQWIIDTAD
jgi:serine/threonine protein phosphatase 1